MRIHILGLFPDLFNQYFSTSLLGKAQEKGLVHFFYHQLRDYADNDYGSVDDKPYGGGAGQLFRADIVVEAVRDLKRKHAIQHVVLLSPTGPLLTGLRARSLAQFSDILFICGRYEGVDQRIVDLVVDEEISIGDYVLTNGELAACVVVDALTRFIPGVVGKAESVANDSFESGLLEAPQFTRPETFENISVPPVLLSGHHENIAHWRRRESLRLTWQRRPDLLKKAHLSDLEREFIKELIHGR